MSVLDLVISNHEIVRFNDIVLSTENTEILMQISKEIKYAAQLEKHKLPLTNKLLFFGNSGCGKTMCAKALAQEVNKKLFIVNLSNIINSKIGETSQNIKAVFDKVAKENAVLFLDEFDHIGKARGNDDNDVGEMRRLVNSIIQLIDLFPSHSILIAATNHPEIIDNALLRRFEIKLNFELPSKEVLENYYSKFLSNYDASLIDFERKYEVSFAEAKDYAILQMKKKLIANIENESSNT